MGDWDKRLRSSLNVLTQPAPRPISRETKGPYCAQIGFYMFQEGVCPIEQEVVPPFRKFRCPISGSLLRSLLCFMSTGFKRNPHQNSQRSARSVTCCVESSWTPPNAIVSFRMFAHMNKATSNCCVAQEDVCLPHVLLPHDA